jgi:hypothetical protein
MIITVSTLDNGNNNPDQNIWCHDVNLCHFSFLDEHPPLIYFHFCLIVQWIGFRENLQETIDFPSKYGAFL